MKQCLIIRQPGPCQVCQRIDAFYQGSDVQAFQVNIRFHEFDLIEPRQGHGRLAPPRSGPHPTASRQQGLHQVTADEPGGAGDQDLHSTFNSGTAMTKRPSH